MACLQAVEKTVAVARTQAAASAVASAVAARRPAVEKTVAVARLQAAAAAVARRPAVEKTAEAAAAAHRMHPHVLASAATWAGPTAQQQIFGARSARKSFGVMRRGRGWERHVGC